MTRKQQLLNSIRNTTLANTNTKAQLTGLLKGMSSSNINKIYNSSTKGRTTINFRTLESQIHDILYFKMLNSGAFNNTGYY